MNIEEKKINKLTIKECRSAIRKLKRENEDYEADMENAEWGIYANEHTIDKIKERLKKLTPKK